MKEVAFAIDGAFDSETSEVPETSAQNTTKMYRKRHKSQIFREKMTSGNSRDAFFSENVEHWQGARYRLPKIDNHINDHQLINELSIKVPPSPLILSLP